MTKGAGRSRGRPRLVYGGSVTLIGMAGRPKHRARVAAAVARGEPPPPKPQASDPAASAALEAEKQRLRELTGHFSKVRCTHRHPNGRRCKSWSVWGLDVCIQHGGMDPKRHEELKERLGIFAEMLDPKKLIVRAHQIIDADLGMITDEAGKFLPFKEWPREILPAIQSIKILNWNADPHDGKTECVVEVRLVDQARYHENLMREAGQLIDHLKIDGKMRHEHTVAQEFVDALRQGLERAADAKAPVEYRCPHCHREIPANLVPALPEGQAPKPITLDAVVVEPVPRGRDDE